MSMDNLQGLVQWSTGRLHCESVLFVPINAYAHGWMIFVKAAWSLGVGAGIGCVEMGLRLSSTGSCRGKTISKKESIPSGPMYMALCLPFCVLLQSSTLK